FQKKKQLHFTNSSAVKSGNDSICIDTHYINKRIKTMCTDILIIQNEKIFDLLQRVLDAIEIALWRQ
ncbi:MAG: hypothetical protein L6282_02150, partial [Candidatus Methanoperedenaceae archaeon]|nr:hypothetical protein [Candidatus Methanoperedenaceae archaeon]